MASSCWPSGRIATRLRRVSSVPADPAEWPPFETSYKQMLDALDWITAENRRTGSPFNGKVAVDKVAAMGHSCGGLQTVKVSTDPRITTAVVLNSGMITDDDQYMIRHELKRSVLDADARAHRLLHRRRDRHRVRQFGNGLEGSAGAAEDGDVFTS